MKNKGFTLIELLIVLAIIGVLTSFLMANFIGAKARARDAQRKADLRQLQSAFELYRSDQGSYPTTGQLPACGNNSLSANGTVYLQKIPCDPQSGSYSYTSNGTTYTLRACLENANDSQKDSSNKAPCAGGTKNWSYTLTNP